MFVSSRALFLVLCLISPIITFLIRVPALLVNFHALPLVRISNAKTSCLFPALLFWNLILPHLFHILQHYSFLLLLWQSKGLHDLFAPSAFMFYEFIDLLSKNLYINKSYKVSCEVFLHNVEYLKKLWSCFIMVIAPRLGGAVFIKASTHRTQPCLRLPHACWLLLPIFACYIYHRNS